MLRIRLRRQGARKQPTYRIVVADQRHARDGRFVEVIGHYNPRTEPAVAQVDEERAFHWLGNGARPSEAVARIFGWTGTQERFLRLRGGEQLSELLAEAAKAAAERPAPTQTRRDAPDVPTRPKSLSEDELLEQDKELDSGVGGAESDKEQDEDTSSKSKTETEAGMELHADSPTQDGGDVAVAENVDGQSEVEVESKAEDEKEDA